MCALNGINPLPWESQKNIHPDYGIKAFKACGYKGLTMIFKGKNKTKQNKVGC